MKPAGLSRTLREEIQSYGARDFVYRLPYVIARIKDWAP